MGYSAEWIKVINEVSDFQKGKKNTWFRGQNSSKYHLNSGLYRLKFNNQRSYLSKELNSYETFKRMGYMQHKESSWNLLFIMQHHGVKTRLLDWTESFAVALYFACQGWDDKRNNAVVWLLDPLQLNKLTLEKSIFYTPDDEYEKYLRNNAEFHDNSLALYPIRNNNRIISQQGMFTIQGKAVKPLEEEFNGELFSLDILKKIEIMPSVKKDVHGFLKQAGISDFTLFPDLDGLARHINKEIYHQ